MTNYEKLQPRAERDAPIAPNPESDVYIAIQPVQSGPMMIHDDVDVTTAQPVHPGPMQIKDDVDENADPSVQTSSTQMDADVDVAAVHPVQPSPLLGDVDSDVTPVQPIKLEPTLAMDTADANPVQLVDPDSILVEQVADLSPVQPIQTDPVVAEASSAPIAIHEVTYASENTSALTTNDWLEGFGSFVLEGTLLQTTKWHYAAGGFYDKMSIISDGLLVTDADQLVINVEDEGHTVHYTEWHKGIYGHHTEYHYYTAIDASNASGYVTYQGMTKNHWTGETSLTGKFYNFANVFKGGDYGNSITGGFYDDTLIGGAGDDTFYSTGGDNTWTGEGGDNTFVLTGGSSTITDFTFGSDTIVIHKEAYVDGSVNLRDNLNWVEGDEAWTLYDTTGSSAQILVVLEKGDGFNGPVDVDLYGPNGTIDTVTPGTSTQIGLSVDQFV